MEPQEFGSRLCIRYCFGMHIQETIFNFPVFSSSFDLPLNSPFEENGKITPHPCQNPLIGNSSVAV